MMSDPHVCYPNHSEAIVHLSCPDITKNWYINMNMKLSSSSQELGMVKMFRALVALAQDLGLVLSMEAQQHS